jgi:hypothetical protein
LSGSGTPGETEPGPGVQVQQCGIRDLLSHSVSWPWGHGSSSSELCSSSTCPSGQVALLRVGDCLQKLLIPSPIQHALGGTGLRRKRKEKKPEPEGASTLSGPNVKRHLGTLALGSKAPGWQKPVPSRAATDLWQAPVSYPPCRIQSDFFGEEQASEGFRLRSVL